MKFSLIFQVCLVLSLLTGVYAFTSTTATTTYYLVRHAEKACEDCASCDLAVPRGKNRAVALADLLQSKGIDRIYTSECLRTQQTAKPLADRLHLPVNIYKTGGLKAFIKNLKTTTHKSVLVVGHSDQIPMMVESIAHQRVRIGPNDFDKMFVITKQKLLKPKITLRSTTYGVINGN